MYVQYWSLGATAESQLPMTKEEISAHLVQDWVPSIPTSVSSSFMGWPLTLIEDVSIGTRSYLSMRREVGTIERQWKRFMSWMLGVAGTRHVLASEHYRWIAPVSAFDPRAFQEVDVTTGWYTLFPRNTVTATRDPTSSAHLSPDYLAIRDKPGGGFEWAAVEAKGTCNCLTEMVRCPRNWRAQSRNVKVRVGGRILKIPRHIVVATRVNPNAIFAQTRRLQIRAWNSWEPSEEIAAQAVVEIVVAHLFGLFSNLRLRENARALAFSVLAREESRQLRQHDQTFSKLQIANKRADEELKERANFRWAPELGTELFEVSTEYGEIAIQISAATMSLTRRLSRSITTEDGIKAIIDETQELKKWESQARDKAWIVLNSGVRVNFRTKSQSLE